jgi:hypothetical protein
MENGKWRTLARALAGGGLAFNPKSKIENPKSGRGVASG